MNRLTNKRVGTNDYFASRNKMPVDYSAILNVCIGGECINKLGQLEDIEEELGIDLVTLFKALENGIYACKDNHIVEIKSQKGNCGAMRFYISHNCIIAEDVFEQRYSYSLKDYGKTWALTREELGK